jgi:hypothetical protein
LEENLIEKVVEMLFGQIYGMLTALCGDKICNVDGSSPTPRGTPDTPIVSLSPISDSQKAICSPIFVRWSKSNN